MKTKILATLLTLVLVVSIFNVCLMVTEAAELTPDMSVNYCNLSFRDSVCIKYAVKSNVSDIKLLVWRTPQEEYVIGTHDEEITEYYTENISGESHYIFDYNSLRAKNMTDVVYVRVYAQKDGVDYYSDLNKYSILQYAYNKLGKTGVATTDENLKAMLVQMLEYGAATQKYFNYKTDKLTTSDWYQIKVTDGTLDDGSKNGLYTQGDRVVLTAPISDSDGCEFLYWEDSDGNEVSTNSTFELVVGTENKIYTPVYGEVFYSKGLEYILNYPYRNAYIVTGIGTCTDTDIIIPATYNELPVTSIAESAFCDNSNIKSIKIPNSVTSIGNWAFQGCTKLTNVTIGNGVTSIGESAFSVCSSLTSIEISNSLTSIGDWAFNYCTSLTSIEIPDSVTSIGYQAFNCCTSLTSIEIPDSVTSILDQAFAGCTKLTNVTIGNGVTSIVMAFWKCESLTSVTIGNGVTVIGGGTFFGCEDLTTINYNGTVAQWQAISKPKVSVNYDYLGWDSGSGDYIIYCTDGTVAKDGTVTKFVNDGPGLPPDVGVEDEGEF